VGTGRVPNIEGLNLETAGIDYSPKGISVDNYLATTNQDVYAVGDCIPGFKFTHNSDLHARYVVRNALFNSQMDYTKIAIPYCTYTDPEVA
jgi:pyruvate/2-oxoglutarate dehydrogenase complex dihydrolipoamide dehydrogenase (E3) component